jgi:hypothetical protein
MNPANRDIHSIFIVKEVLKKMEARKHHMDYTAFTPHLLTVAMLTAYPEHSA